MGLDMTDLLKNLTDAQRDALASSALKISSASRARSKSYRERKKMHGMKQILVWVPEDRAKVLKKKFDDYVSKIVRTEPSDPAA